MNIESDMTSENLHFHDCLLCYDASITAQIETVSLKIIKMSKLFKNFLIFMWLKPTCYILCICGNRNLLYELLVKNKPLHLMCNLIQN